MGLHRVTPHVRFVGSYPRADGVQPQVSRATTDAAFTEARAWLDRLRDGRL
jgi:prephenate dehydratase